MEPKENLLIADCNLVDVSLTPGDDESKATVALETAMTPQLAGMLDCWTLLYDSNETPRAGWKSITLDAEPWTHVHVKTPPGFGDHGLNCIPKSVGAWKVRRLKDAALVLTFHLKLEGYAAHLSDFLDSTHARAFPLEVIPRQGTLYEAFGAEEKAKAKAAGKPN